MNNEDYLFQLRVERIVVYLQLIPPQVVAPISMALYITIGYRGLTEILEVDLERILN